MRFSAPMPRYRIYKIPGFFRIMFRELMTGTWRQGDSLSRLENEISRRLDVPFTVATAQARAAIYLSVKALVGEKRKVIMSPYTIFDIVNMVIAAGGEPVFADLEPNTCNISAESIRSKIDEDTAIVMVTHLHGIACDIRQISELCRKNGIYLIEDSAQAFGTEVDGRQVGTFGDVGIFSFGLAKNVNCVYGGMAVTRSKEIHDSIREIESSFWEFSKGDLFKKALVALVTDLTLSPWLFKVFAFWLFRYGYLHNVELVNKRVTVEDDPVLLATEDEQSALRSLAKLKEEGSIAGELAEKALAHVDDLAREDPR